MKTTALDHKTFDTVESETTEATGAFVALVSTWGVDRHRDQVQPGAFSRTLDEWRESGRMIPSMPITTARSVRWSDTLIRE